MFEIGDNVKINGNRKWGTMSIDGEIGTVVAVEEIFLGCAIADEDKYWPWWIPYEDVIPIET